MKTQEIADFIGGKLVGDGRIEIHSVASVESASVGQITFIGKSSTVIASNASCLIVPDDFPSGIFNSYIRSSNPKLDLSRIAAVLHPAKKPIYEIHPMTMIAKTAFIRENVFVGPFACVGERSEIGSGTQIRHGASIGDNVKIGRNCIIYPRVYVEDGTTIGNDVILHTGVVIGADGFGYVKDDCGYTKFPQVGTVVIENNVEIGANSCVDRGSLGETRIGEGTKIDNLVQIAHNVRIGKRVVIAAQTGISGSTVIEDDCVIGGQVGMGDHATVLSGAIIGSQAGVLPGKIVRAGVWWGTPVQPLDEYKRQNAQLKGIGRLKDSVRSLSERLAAIEDRAGDNDRAE